MIFCVPFILWLLLSGSYSGRSLMWSDTIPGFLGRMFIFVCITFIGWIYYVDWRRSKQTVSTSVTGGYTPPPIRCSTNVKPIEVIQEEEKGGDKSSIEDVYKPKKYLGSVPNPRRLIVKLYHDYNEAEIKILLIHRVKLMQLYKESNFNGEYLEALRDFDSVYNPILYKYKHCRFIASYETMKGGDVG